jgi:hypothetical protein
MAATRSRTALLATLVVSMGLAAIGCADPPVGDPCIPEEMPEGGFTNREPYLEYNSVQCLTRVCMVYHYQGDPLDPEVEASATRRKERDDHIYCTCRCKTDDPRFTTCDCPKGYKCCEVMKSQKVSDGVRGSYCVKEGTERDC